MNQPPARPWPAASLRFSAALVMVLGAGLITLAALSPDRATASIGAESVIAPSAGYLPIIANAYDASAYPNCRLGVGGAISTAYNVNTLNLGWTMDWSTRLNPTRPNGSDYVQVIRLRPDETNLYTFTPSLPILYQIADQNPGAIWLIGNEPDSPFQDNLPPDRYARAYHDLYLLLKQHDPAARIGAGSIVQPTPLRLQYLDRVLTSYWLLYGQALPTDVWSIHSYILREIDASDPEACTDSIDCHEPPYLLWGAYIPPGLLSDFTRGVLYTFGNMFDTAIFHQRLIDFRAWLRDRGYRDVPVYITEFGTLFPYPPFIEGDPYVDEFGAPMTETRSADFMTRTFDLLQTANDPALGLPADENRLVQRWLWYSFADPAFGGALYHPATGQRTPLGDTFAAYAQAITPARDVLAVRAAGDAAYLPPTQPAVTATLAALISNPGNISITTPITVTFFTGPIAQPGAMIGAPIVITRDLAGCGATLAVTMTWPDLTVGAHVFHFKAESSGLETNTGNNRSQGTLFVGDRIVWLPVTIRAPQ